MPHFASTLTLTEARQATGGVQTGAFTFVDPFDPNVGVLLFPDIGMHVDQFQGSFLVSVLFLPIPH